MPTLAVTTCVACITVAVHLHYNGTAIPADLSDRRFQPVFTTESTGRGAGLGLCVTYEID